MLEQVSSVWIKLNVSNCGIISISFRRTSASLHLYIHTLLHLSFLSSSTTLCPCVLVLPFTLLTYHSLLFSSAFFVSSLSLLLSSPLCLLSSLLTLVPLTRLSSSFPSVAFPPFHHPPLLPSLLLLSLLLHFPSPSSSLHPSPLLHSPSTLPPSLPF